MDSNEIPRLIGELQSKVNEVEQLAKSLIPKVEKLEGKKTELDEAQLVFSVWTKIVDCQMHFNDMVMRVRGLAVTLLLAAFGAAAYSLQSPVFLSVFGRSVHISFFVIVFGLAGWIALWLMDLGHFHKLLRGAVNKGIEVETSYKKTPHIGPLLGMTECITEESRKFIGERKMTAAVKLAICYGIILVCGLAFCFIIWNSVRTDTIPPQAKESLLKISPDSLTLRVEQAPLLIQQACPPRKHSLAPGNGNKEKCDKSKGPEEGSK